MDFEQRARMTKARRIAEFCRAEGIDADQLVYDGMTEDVDTLRSLVCHNAGAKPASTETWALVIGLLGAAQEMSESQRAAYETAANGPGNDPFAGLQS